MTQREPNLIDRVASLIPGYRGYADRERRRDADKRLRDHVAATLDDARRHLDGIIDAQSRGSDLAAVGALDALKRVLGTCADSLRHAQRGASGLMDDVVVRAADLDRVLQADLALQQDAAGLCGEVRALTAPAAAAQAPALRSRAEALLGAVRRRDDLLTEVFPCQG